MAAGGSSASHWDSESSSSDGDDDVMHATALLVYVEQFENPDGWVHRVPCRTSALSGRAWVEEIIQGHPARLLENARFTVDSFMRLCRILTHYGFVLESYASKVTIEEALAMTLVVLSQSHTHRTLAERFQHSTETINRNVKKVVNGLCQLGNFYITPRGQDQVHSRIATNRKAFPWFKDCVGALDGTHIPAHPPPGEQVAYTDRTGGRSQNVLAVCDFDMRFIFVYAGWEGSAHDARVLDAALSGPNSFPIPPTGKYYLVDSAYRNVPGFLAPYRGNVVPIGGGGRTGRRTSRTAKELFNTRHSSIRNVIERSFGVLKSRFKILKGSMPNYKMSTQIKFVIACCTLHNYVRDVLPDDDIFGQYAEDVEVYDNDVNDPPTLNPLNVPDDVVDDWKEMRDGMAAAMWNSYGRRG